MQTDPNFWQMFQRRPCVSWNRSLFADDSAHFSLYCVELFVSFPAESCSILQVIMWRLKGIFVCRQLDLNLKMWFFDFIGCYIKSDNLYPTYNTTNNTWLTHIHTKVEWLSLEVPSSLYSIKQATNNWINLRLLEDYSIVLQQNKKMFLSVKLLKHNSIKLVELLLVE